MLNEKTLIAFWYLLMCAATALMCSCARPPETQPEAPPHPQKAEAPPQPQQVPEAQPQPTETSQPKPAEATRLPQPKIADVQDAIKRIFQNAVDLDGKRNPSFFVGDFNGDGSQDLAVVVKPVEGMLAEINGELANWILEDPRTVSAPGSSTAERRPPPRAVVQKGDELIAIIHGFGPTGWRNPSAKQTYLLKGVAGINMKSQLAKELQSGAKANEKLPPVRGDVISEMLAGEPGLIFWTGSKYAWHRRAE